MRSSAYALLVDLYKRTMTDTEFIHYVHGTLSIMALSSLPPCTGRDWGG